MGWRSLRDTAAAVDIKVASVPSWNLGLRRRRLLVRARDAPVMLDCLLGSQVPHTNPQIFGSQIRRSTIVLATTQSEDENVCGRNGPRPNLRCAETRWSFEVDREPVPVPVLRIEEIVFPQS